MSCKAKFELSTELKTETKGSNGTLLWLPELHQTALNSHKWNVNAVCVSWRPTADRCFLGVLRVASHTEPPQQSRRPSSSPRHPTSFLQWWTTVTTLHHKIKLKYIVIPQGHNAPSQAALHAFELLSCARNSESSAFCSKNRVC